MSNMKVTYTSERKNSDGFQKVVQIKDVEICKIFKDIKSAPIPFVGDFVTYLRTIAKGNYLDCCEGIVGKLAMINGTFANFSALNMYPQGDYKSIFHYFDNQDSNILNVTFLSHITKF